MSKSKKIIINIICGIFILAAGFGAGRGLRLTRAESSSRELEQRITEGIDTASDITDRSNTAGAIADSIASSGRPVTEGLGTMQLSTERLEFFWTEVVRAVEADQAATAAFKRVHGDSASSTVDALDIAIQHSEQYEALISSLQRAIDASNENNQKSE